MSQNGRGLGPQSGASKRAATMSPPPQRPGRVHDDRSSEAATKNKSVSDIFACPSTLSPVGTPHPQAPACRDETRAAYSASQARAHPSRCPNTQEPRSRPSDHATAPSSSGSSPPLRRITAFASLLRRLCCQSLVTTLRAALLDFARHPSHLPILRSAAYSRLLSLSPSPGTRTAQNRRTVLFPPYDSLTIRVAHHRVRP